MPEKPDWVDSAEWRYANFDGEVFAARLIRSGPTPEAVEFTHFDCDWQCVRVPWSIVRERIASATRWRALVGDSCWAPPPGLPWVLDYGESLFAASVLYAAFAHEEAP